MSWGAKKVWYELRNKEPRLVRWIMRYERWEWNAMRNIKDRDEVIWAEMTRHDAAYYRRWYQKATEWRNMTKGR